MLPFSKTILFFLFIHSFAFTRGDVPAPWTPVDWKTLPPADPGDTIEMFYLVAPLLEEELGSLLGKLGLYHGALAFANKNTNFSITINYDANDIFRASFFPEIVTYPNGSKDLLWDNGGAVFIYLSINDSYWISGNDKVAIINGELYNRFISKWNSVVNETFPYYEICSVTSHLKGDYYLKSWDCFDYVWEAFQVVYDWGTELNYSLSLKRNFCDLFVSEPPLDVTVLYYSDPNVRKDIVDFYEFIQLQWRKMSLKDFLFTLYETFDGIFYYRYETEYYKLHLRFPFVGIYWYEQELPGSSNRTANL